LWYCNPAYLSENCTELDATITVTAFPSAEINGKIIGDPLLTLPGSVWNTCSRNISIDEPIL
jgi:hypothetical protein